MSCYLPKPTGRHTLITHPSVRRSEKLVSQLPKEREREKEEDISCRTEEAENLPLQGRIETDGAAAAHCMELRTVDIACAHTKSIIFPIELSLFPKRIHRVFFA